MNNAIDQTFTYKQLSEWLNKIYHKQEPSFKIDIGFGYVLLYPVPNEYKFYFVPDKSTLFEKALTIDYEKDLDRYVKKGCCGRSCYNSLSFKTKQGMGLM